MKLADALQMVALTDPGRSRSHNEDAVFADAALGIAVLADGMGGYSAGEVASGEAVDTVYGMVKRGVGPLGDLNAQLDENRGRAVCRLLEGAIQAAT